MQSESFKLRQGYSSIVHSGFFSSPVFSLSSSHHLKQKCGKGQRYFHVEGFVLLMYLRGGNELISDY